MIKDSTPKVYLSKRNLLTLLSKLSRDANGEQTECTILKYQGDTPEYQQTMKEIAVIAVQDDEYYESQGRPAGTVHGADEPTSTPPGVVSTIMELVDEYGRQMKYSPYPTVDARSAVLAAVDGLVTERDEYRTKYNETYQALNDAARENIVLKNQEPVAWQRIRADGSFGDVSTMKPLGHWRDKLRPLYTATGANMS